MKRIAALLAALVLLAVALPASAAKKKAEVYSWDFDLHFHLDAEKYPLRERKQIRGYADLLELLELRGNVSFCPDTQSMDLSADLIPKTNPSAAIHFRLYGIPDYMCLESPLLTETIFLHNYSLMAFAGKAWENFRFPLPYLILLDPYVTTGAFQCLADAWTEQVGAITKSCTVSKAVLQKVADAWRNLFETDYRLTSWIRAATAPLPDSLLVEKEIRSLPDLLLKVSNKKALSFKVKKDGTLTCLNNKKQVLFQRRSSGQEFSCSLTLPETAGNYIPAFDYLFSRGDPGSSLSLQASWDRSPSAGEAENLPESLLGVNLRVDGIPEALPANAEITASLKVEGYSLPNFEIALDFTSSEDGSIRLTLSRPFGEEAAARVFECTGTLTPASYEGTLKFKASKLSKNFNIFAVNESSLYDFMHRSARPLFDGLLNFLYELPASSCQSIMDALEDSGILGLILK